METNFSFWERKGIHTHGVSFSNCDLNIDLCYPKKII